MTAPPDHEIFVLLTDLGVPHYSLTIRRPRGGPPMLEWSTSTVGPVPADRYINLPWAKPSSYDHPGRQRFTDEEATKIRRAYWRGDETIAGLARRFGVTEVTISRIVHGLSYWWTC